MKYVYMYSYISPGHGVVINGITFDSGFAFSGKLCFLGMNVIIDFVVIQKSGLQLYAEI